MEKKEDQNGNKSVRIHTLIHVLFVGDTPNIPIPLHRSHHVTCELSNMLMLVNRSSQMTT